MTRVFANIYWLIAFLHLGGEALGIIELQYSTKPLLMPMLIAWYLSATQQKRTPIHWLMTVAFVFSCAGDVLLMFDREDLFLPGLVSFLVTHILYIICFNKEISGKEGEQIIKQKPWLAIPVVLLAGGLIALVFGRIEQAMKVPVIIYATVITLMVITAINRYQKVSRLSYQSALAGALLFMLSDSLIAVNKFYFGGSLEHAGFAIMLLYITGQYLIARGTAKTT